MELTVNRWDPVALLLFEGSVRYTLILRRGIIIISSQLLIWLQLTLGTRQLMELNVLTLCEQLKTTSNWVPGWWREITNSNQPAHRVSAMILLPLCYLLYWSPHKCISHPNLLTLASLLSSPSSSPKEKLLHSICCSSTMTMAGQQILVQ